MKGNAKDFKVIHPEDILVLAEHKEKLYTESGIIITVNPSVTADRPTRGVVVGRGDSSRLEIGDTVFFGIDKGHDLYFDDNKEEWYILLDSGVILGKLCQK